MRKYLSVVASLFVLFSTVNAAALTIVPQCVVQDETIQMTPDLNCLSVSFGAESFSCRVEQGGKPSLILENHCLVQLVIEDHPELNCPTLDCWDTRESILPNESVVMSICPPSKDYLDGVSGSWRYLVTMEDDTYDLDVSYTIVPARFEGTGGCQQLGVGGMLGWILSFMGVLWVRRRP